MSGCVSSAKVVLIFNLAKFFIKIHSKCNFINIINDIFAIHKADKNTFLTRVRYILHSCVTALMLFIGLQNTCGQTIRHILPNFKVIDRPAADTIRICIMGDMMMHEAQIAAATTKDGSHEFSSYFQFIADDIRNADIAIANMEYTLAGEPYSGYPCFSAPESYAAYLADCGFDVFLAANNHIFDKGSQGAEKTLEIYRTLEKSHNIRFTGLAGDETER